MKVLWLVNIILPNIAGYIGVDAPVVGGWLVRSAGELLKSEEIALTVCYPQNNEKKVVKGITGKLQYYGFYEDRKRVERYDERLEKIFTNIIEEVGPDVIHIMGTEYPHTLAMVNSADQKNMLDKVVISIQGLISEYAKVYLDGVPDFVLKRQTFRDFIKKDGLLKQKEKYEHRGCFEIEALRKARNVIGRTDWDKNCCMALNPQVDYYKNDETLRQEFYKEKWSIEKCEKGRLFMSQGAYPIKGLHILLKALTKVLIESPEVCLYVSGEDILSKPRWKYGAYEKYIDKLIKKSELGEKVKFLGNLQPEEMCQQLLKANVFVLPSLIENSPNSLGEAMLMGVPCVAAKVGGVKSMINEDEGMLCDKENIEQLSQGISRLLKNDHLCSEMSKKSKKHAETTHDAKRNYQELLRIYRTLNG